MKRLRRRISFAYLSLARRLGRTVTFRRDGVRWRIDSEDTSIGWNLFVHGSFEQTERRAAIAWLKARGAFARKRLVIDVGANIGPAAVALAMDHELDVVAIEPVSSHLDLLEWNIAANGLREVVTIVPGGVSSRKSEADIFIPPDNHGGAELGSVAEIAAHPEYELADWRRERVELAPLPELLARAGRRPGEVALVWSDTQAREGDVIESGAELWSSGVPMWVEYWPAGLARHGLLAGFRSRACGSFAAFLTAETLVAEGAAAEPVDLSEKELARVADGVSCENGKTDLLLLPQPFLSGPASSSRR